MIEKLFVRLARAGARAFPPPPPPGCLQRLTQACQLPPWAVPAVAVAATNGDLLAPGPSIGTAWPFVFLGVAGGMVAGSTGTVHFTITTPDVLKGPIFSASRGKAWSDTR